MRNKLIIPKTKVSCTNGVEITSTKTAILERILKENGVKTFGEAKRFFNSISKKRPKGMGHMTYRFFEDIINKRYEK